MMKGINWSLDTECLGDLLYCSIPVLKALPPNRILVLSLYRGEMKVFPFTVRKAELPYKGRNSRKG